MTCGRRSARRNKKNNEKLGEMICSADRLLCPAGDKLSSFNQGGSLSTDQTA